MSLDRRVPLAALLLMSALLPGCLVGTPLQNGTEEGLAERVERGPETVTRRWRLQAEWSVDDRRVAEVRTTLDTEARWRETTFVGSKTVYRYGQYSLVYDLLWENTIAHFYQPILFVVDLFRMPYYMILGEWEVAGRAAAGILYMLPGIQMASEDAEGFSPLSPTGGAVTYLENEREQGSEEKVETRSAPASATITVYVGQKAVHRLKTDEAGAASFRPAEWDRVRRALAETGARRLVLTAGEGEERGQVTLDLTDWQLRGLLTAGEGGGAAPAMARTKTAPCPVCGEARGDVSPCPHCGLE